MMTRSIALGVALCALMALTGCFNHSSVNPGPDSEMYMNVRVTLIPRDGGMAKFQDHPVYLLTITQEFVMLQEHGETPEDNGPYTMVPLDLIRELSFRGDPDRP